MAIPLETTGTVEGNYNTSVEMVCKEIDVL